MAETFYGRSYYGSHPKLSTSSVEKIRYVAKVKRKQCTGIGTRRTQILPSKPKREITKITNRHNTKRTFGHPSKQFFPKRWQLSHLKRTKLICTCIRQNVTETDIKLEFMFMKHYAPNRCKPNIEALNIEGGGGGGGQGRCERRSVVFVKFQKKYFLWGVRVDVDGEVKFM